MLQRVLHTTLVLVGEIRLRRGCGFGGHDRLCLHRADRTREHEPGRHRHDDPRNRKKKDEHRAYAFG